MEDELREGRLPRPLNANMQALITHNPDTLTQWLGYMNAYLSIPTVEPKIVYLAMLPEGYAGRPEVLQILVSRHCLFYHVVHAPPELPDSLRQFLANWRYTFVGGDIDLDLVRLHFYYQMGGPDSQRLELNLLEMNITSPRPQHVLEADWRVERLGDYEIRFYFFEGYATHLLTSATYWATAGFWTALSILAEYYFYY